MPRRLAAVALPFALALAGCGAAGNQFEGEERAVAETVGELSSAAQGAKGDEICSRLLGPELVDRLADGSRSCAQEVTAAVRDAQDHTLTVKAVEVRGTSATARVEDGDGREQRLELVKQGEDWKVSAFGAAG